MFRYLIIDGEKLFNYSINEEGTVVNSKKKKLKRRGNTYRLYVNGKHRSFNANDLIEWAFKDKKKEEPKEESYVDTTIGSYLAFEKIVNEKGMDVRNDDEIINNFLTILDPDLYNIDPNSNFLSDETKNKIIEECKSNPWYFFRRVLELPIDMLVFTTVKSTLSGIDAYLEGPENYLYHVLQRSIISYLVLFGNKDVVVTNDERYDHISGFMNLDKDHWLYSIPSKRILYTQSGRDTYNWNIMNGTIIININHELVVKLSGYITERPFRTSFPDINVISFTPCDSAGESKFGSIPENFNKDNILGSTHLLVSESKKRVDPSVYFKFDTIELGGVVSKNTKVGFEGYNAFYTKDFDIKDSTSLLFLNSFNEAVKAYVIAKLRKNGKKFFEFAKRFLDNELNIQEVDRMNDDIIIGLFTVIRDKFINDIHSASKNMDREDLVYMLFGTQNYDEINMKLSHRDSYERHILCMIYSANAKKLTTQNPIPVGLSVEGFLKVLYR